MPFFGSHAGAAGQAAPLAATITYTDDATDPNSLSVYTFSSVIIGAAADRSHVIIGVGTSGTPGATITKVELDDGTGFSDMTQAIMYAPSRTAGLYIIASTSGTTATVRVTISATQSRCGIGAWRITGVASTTASDTASDDDAIPMSAVLTVPAAGIGVGMSHSNIGAGAISWTTLTQDFAVDAEVTNFAVSGASGTSGGTVTCTHTGSTVAVMVLASFA